MRIPVHTVDRDICRGRRNLSRIHVYRPFDIQCNRISGVPCRQQVAEVRYSRTCHNPYLSVDCLSYGLLYYFDRFGRPVSHGEWLWPKSVGCPASQRWWPPRKGIKIGQIFKISAGRPNSRQVLAEILHLSQGIFKLANAKISATLVPCPTPGRIDRNSTVSQVLG